MSSYVIPVGPSVTQPDPEVAEASQQSETLPGNLQKKQQTNSLSNLHAKNPRPPSDVLSFASWKRSVQTGGWLFAISTWHEAFAIQSEGQKGHFLFFSFFFFFLQSGRNNNNVQLY